MLRRVALSLPIAFIVASLSGCGLFFDSEEREPWRAEVEAACIASGQVRETAGIRMTQAVEGPGACGLEHPFRVSALDQPPPMTYAAMGDPDGAFPATDMPPTEGSAFAVALDRSVMLSCSMVPALTRWLATDVQPAALAAFGSPVIEMRSFGSYSCRRRNNARRGRLSEHAFANAIDVKGFRLADGRETMVLGGWTGTPEERAFWRDVAYGACQRFTTVLGPGTSDGHHENHLHLDLARHSTSRELHVCRPRVPAGWVSMAQQKGLTAGSADFTGSIEEPLRGEDDQ
jgi:hypothetical protein